MDQATLETGAEQALDSPAVEGLVLSALVRSHRAFLGEDEAPDALDGDAFGSAARASVVGARPELDGLLPEAPSFQVPLPTQRIPDAGPVRRGLLTAVPVMAAVAALGALLALVVTTDRPGVIRRAGIWAVGLSAVVLLFAYGVPAFAHEVAPAQAEVVATLVAALAATTRGPALALAAAGVAGILASAAWSRAAATDRAPAAVAPARARRGGATARHRHRRDLPTPGRRPSQPDRTDQIPASPAPPGEPSRRPGPPAHPDVTRVEPPSARSSPPAREGARWVEGVGWVHEGTGEIPETARWVPGVGYVLED